MSPRTVPPTGDFHSPLLRWYRRHRRDFPWRATVDPYAIWISETMLQQTRAETVLRYYPRFLDRFPTVAHLSRARESSVLTSWSGLGYYSRARSLRHAAREIVARHGGRLPADPRALEALPGIGRYTAGAVASIAFAVPAPVVDGNVARVLARAFGLRGRLRTAATERRLWKIATSLVPRTRPGDWNQALMELGATVCTPRAPDCARCPIARHCVALARDQVERLPTPPQRAATVGVKRAVAIVERNGKVLLVHRREGRRLRGLYEFPGTTLRTKGAFDRQLRAELRRIGVTRAGRLQPFATFRHAIMNERIETLVFRAEAISTDGTMTAARWIAAKQLRSLPLSTVGVRIAERLGALTETPRKDRRRPSRHRYTW